jgi:hypothetical protein
VNERPKIWVEFRGGGPFDGTMIQMDFPMSGMVLYPKVEPGDAPAKARGVYKLGAPIVDGLDVYAMDWSRDVDEDLQDNPFRHRKG